MKRNVRPSTKPLSLEKKKETKKVPKKASPSPVIVRKEKDRQKLRIEIDK